MKYILGLFIVLVLFGACNNSKTPLLSDEDIVHGNEDQLTQLIIYDVFNPPVASRVYAYTSLAAYEALRYNDPVKYPSIITRLNGFNKIPAPQEGKKYNFTLAATQAFLSVARKVVFSVDSFITYENKVHDQFKSQLDDSTYAHSIDFGNSIAKVILQRTKTDNYPQSRGKPKYIGSNLPGKWRPTPPDYLDGVEYCWGTMQTFVLDSSSQFAPPAPIPFSADTTSEFYRQNADVYRIAINLTPEQKSIARFWDDNPFVLEHSGHMMFANKKITPGGHWMGIARIACKKTNADALKAAQVYALTAIALYDGFICCWQEKYRYNVIRPVTVINEKMDPNWLPFLQTPPFPEYPSGHSTITRAAATVLTKLFGDNFSFTDSSELPYIGMKRDFESFVQASNEASISRVYGGIHYLNSVNAGAEQGRELGEYVIRKLAF
jgi:hypothetical protein